MRVEVLSGLCGVFKAVAACEKGVLPASWIALKKGPGSPNYKPTRADCATLRAALMHAVAYVYLY